MSITAQKMKFPIKDFFGKCDQFPADLVTFPEEILNGKLHFFEQWILSVWMETEENYLPSVKKRKMELSATGNVNEKLQKTVWV